MSKDRKNIDLASAILHSRISQREISKRIGISDAYLSLIIHGQRPGTPAINKRLARILHSTVGELGLQRKAK